ncbi:hypothetical protein ACTFIR_012853 [Dictyostelium discoideum]
MPNPIPFSIPEGPKSDCITKEVQDLLLDDAIEQVLPNRYSKRVFYSNVFTVPKPVKKPSLDDTNPQACPVRHLSTYLRASKGRRKPHSGDSVFIQNDSNPLDVKEINIIVSKFLLFFRKFFILRMF